MQKETNVDTNSSILYIVSTPIGNLKDITLRALEVLEKSDIIVCEDTRITRKILSHYNIKNKFLISYGNHNLKKVTPQIITLLKENKVISLVSDAGTPLISDPGYELVQECKNKNIKITTIPGPSSLISALILSGTNLKDFYFGGFLENKLSKLKKQLTTAKSIQTNIVYFVAANKLTNILKYIIEVFGKDQKLILVREITKLFEEVIVDKAILLLNRLNIQSILGEVVLILPHSNKNSSLVSTEELSNILQKTLNQHNFKDSLSIIVNSYKQKGVKLNKKELYNLGLSIKANSNTNY